MRPAPEPLRHERRLALTSLDPHPRSWLVMSSSEQPLEAPTVSPLPSPQALPHIRLAPSRGFQALGLTELWAYRELLYFLAWRDIKVRYKQTVLGGAWAIIQPVMT